MADTIENRRLLAEEYLAVGRYDEALPLYEGALTGLHADDPSLLLRPQVRQRAAHELHRAEYSSESALSHTFKRIAGTSPRSYRELALDSP